MAVVVPVTQNVTTIPTVQMENVKAECVSLFVATATKTSASSVMTVIGAMATVVTATVS